MVIFEKSRKNAKAHGQFPKQQDRSLDLPEHLLRQDKPCLPELSELEVIRHFHELSHKNFSIDGQFYPLGSCTMKYNPRGVQNLAMQPKISKVHPNIPTNHTQGYLQCLYELQNYLVSITGMKEVALSPMAGAQGEFAGVAMIRKYHQSRGDHKRKVMLVPDSAHGTNPASAVMCGYKIKEVPTNREGDLDFEALAQALGDDTAGIMLTNPSTLGLFERNIEKVAKMVHEAGGLLYYDGANLNAILGKTRPGDMGFDVMHMNMHKTFATPHGGGGPGSGPVAANERLAPFLPVPRVGLNTSQEYVWLSDKECPQSIGYMSAFMGNAAILYRAYLYISMLGKEGLERVGEFATLNANYLKEKFKQHNIPLAYPDRMASHEFLTTFAKLKKEKGVTAMDLAKRLLDYNVHAPTTYFPLGVPECFLIEPTETEAKTTLDRFIEIMTTVLKEAYDDPEKVLTAPHECPVSRLDDVRAAKELKLRWQPVPGTTDG